MGVLHIFRYFVFIILSFINHLIKLQEKLSLIKVTFTVDFFANRVILLPVMRDMTDNQFKQLAATRMGQMREWKAIPESTRPTWEQFKRGLKLKKVNFKG